MSDYRVTEVMRAAIDALDALAPIVSRVGISSRASDSDVEWDAIQKQLVLSMIGEADQLQRSDLLPISYGAFRSAYRQHSFIGILKGDLQPKGAALVEFVAENDVFDKLVVQRLDWALNTLDTLTIAVSDIEFVLCLNAGGVIEVVDTIS